MGKRSALACWRCFQDTEGCECLTSRDGVLREEDRAQAAQQAARMSERTGSG